jgi:hypothetical protein
MCVRVIPADTAIITILFANVGKFDQPAQINGVAHVLLFDFSGIIKQKLLFLTLGAE